MSETTLTIKRGDLWKLPLSQLRIVEGFNAREDFGDLEELAQSISENGIKNPIRGFKEKGEDIYYVTNGERRYRASKLLHEPKYDTNDSIDNAATDIIVGIAETLLSDDSSDSSSDFSSGSDSSSDSSSFDGFGGGDSSGGGASGDF